MGRILTEVTITNGLDRTRSVTVNALVDTASTFLVMPLAMLPALGELEELEPVQVELADQRAATARRFGPVLLQIAGQPAFFDEVMFLEMEKRAHGYDVLLGYVPLEKALLAVDMVSHRLVPVKAFDLKGVYPVTKTAA